MSLMDRLADWGDPSNYDPDPEPTPESMLRQFLYSAVTDFIEENSVRLAEWLVLSTDPEIPGLDEWVDEYAERPLSEPDGYLREPSGASS